jgi:polysaccharide deacetylase 2 family uncharacterized protein YibQ
MCPPRRCSGFSTTRISARRSSRASSGRAEFAAAQEGAVIVAGRTRPDTVTALFSWALGDRNEGVAIAPVSAVLQRLAEDG